MATTPKTKERDDQVEVVTPEAEGRGGRSVATREGRSVAPGTRAVVQSTYPDRMRAGLPGLLQGSDYDTDTGNCEEADGIGFGLAVSQGAGDKGCLLGGALADFRGVSVRDVTVPATSTLIDKYPQYMNMAVMTRGMVYVEPDGAVAAGDPVHFDGTTGQFSAAGGNGPILGARWVTSNDGLVAMLELSGYNQ